MAMSKGARRAGHAGTVECESEDRGDPAVVSRRGRGGSEPGDPGTRA